MLTVRPRDEDLDWNPDDRPYAETAAPACEKLWWTRDAAAQDWTHGHWRSAVSGRSLASARLQVRHRVWCLAHIPWRVCRCPPNPGLA